MNEIFEVVQDIGTDIPSNSFVTLEFKNIEVEDIRKFKFNEHEKIQRFETNEFHWVNWEVLKNFVVKIYSKRL